MDNRNDRKRVYKYLPSNVLEYVKMKTRGKAAEDFISWVSKASLYFLTLTRHMRRLCILISIERILHRDDIIFDIHTNKEANDHKGPKRELPVTTTTLVQVVLCADLPHVCSSHFHSYPHLHIPA